MASGDVCLLKPRPMTFECTTSRTDENKLTVPRRQEVDHRRTGLGLYWVPEEPAMDLERPLSPVAEDEAYADLRRELTRAVAAVCPRWLAAGREDLVQAAMMRILQIQQRSEGTREFSSSYLWRVAHSALVDEIRRVRLRREQPLGDEAPMGSRTGSAPSPEQEVEGRETGEAIVDCLGRLVRPRRLAVTLHLQGYTVPEVAELLGYGRKRTENLVYRGLANLRRCLASQGLKP